MNSTDYKSSHYSLHTMIAIANQGKFANTHWHAEGSLQLLTTRLLSHNRVVSSGVLCCYCKLAHACLQLYPLQTYPANVRSLIYLPLNLRYGGSTVSWLNVPNKHLTAPFLLQSHCTKWTETEPSSKKKFIGLPNEDCHSNQVAIKTELQQSLTRIKVITEFWVECNMWSSNSCDLQLGKLHKTFCVGLKRCAECPNGQNSSSYWCATKIFQLTISQSMENKVIALALDAFFSNCLSTLNTLIFLFTIRVIKSHFINICTIYF